MRKANHNIAAAAHTAVSFSLLYIEFKCLSNNVERNARSTILPQSNDS